jgi:hypothetical protein
MTIAWYTDNPLSRTVMDAVFSGLSEKSKSGIALLHVNQAMKPCNDAYPMNHVGIFYGILRGCGNLMRMYQYNNIDYYYIDNGYFDALYVNRDTMAKDMSGKFRVVKNGMHEVYPNSGVQANIDINNLLIIPPSEYSANFYDTTPEDWLATMPKGKVRKKDSEVPLEFDIKHADAVIAFNSMAVIKAVEMGKPVMDTHGVFKNQVPMLYYWQDLKDFYEPKQFTLQELRDGKANNLWN